ncbi:AAA family ATPase [Nocardioides bruguierae]|uniref:AAA family ATPase n=1 Tax=Nocardioides bruguierae TaxID=2945102 RepID=UPI0020222776|nr:hypothetical protein [Nocardioides bruguierae]MCL8025690.1 hypothetical protein [Nocardioides bruguierae]
MNPRVVLVAAAGAEWEDAALAALDERAGVVVLKRCMDDVEDLLASAASGQADSAVLGLDAHGLDAGSVDQLRRYGVRPVAVVPTGVDPESARLRAGRVGLRRLVAEASVADVADAVTAPEPGDEPGDEPGSGPGEPGAAPTVGGPRLPPGLDLVALAAAAREREAAEGARAPGDTGDPGPALDGAADDAAAGRDDGDLDDLERLLDEEPPRRGTRPGRPGRVVAVWGPTGAPGRTTVAAGLATLGAARGTDTLLVDADPWGGAVGQHLGVLDEVSGLLATARLAAAGALPERWRTAARALSPTLSVLTGLPRADRWVEVRSGVLEQLLTAASTVGDVVVDTGASLEDDPGAELAGRGARNGTTLAALEAADEVVVVGSADPVGLSRLARGLVDLAEVRPGVRPHVAVNRVRSSLGWSREELADMVRGFGHLSSLHFLPADTEAVDRALVAGRSVAEQRDAALTQALAGLADDALGAAPTGALTTGAGARTVAGRGGARRRARGRLRRAAG